MLDRFLDALASLNKTITKTPITGPYHSPKAYASNDIDHLVEQIIPCVSDLKTSRMPLLSVATHAFLQGQPLLSILALFTKYILTQQLRYINMFDTLSKLLSSPGASYTVATVNARLPPLFKSMLTQWNIKTVTLASFFDEAVDPICGNDDRIAIVGYSGRFPEADGLEEFWDLLKKGLDVHKEIPASRFDGAAHYDATLERKNTSRVKYGCWLKNPGQFDAGFFHISPREAAQTDPAQRIALLTAYEALEMSGFVPDRTPSSQRHRVGVYYGICSDDWREINNGQDVDTYYIPGGVRAFIPGRINYHFKFSGPSLVVDSACSSSLAAIHTAFTALRTRECDTAIAGGANILTNPDNFSGLDRGHFLSHTGNCKTFDNNADGYCRAEGVGTVVLKRYSDAIADNDPIFGVILGAGTNHSADASSITRPSPIAQHSLFTKILSDSHVRPHDVSYIEMHGTGTQAGDAVEMKSVLDTFAWDHSRPKSQPLHIGSVKSNIGHGESASGVMSLIKVLLMMEKNRIPRHCGIKTKINESFPTDLEARGVRIASEETAWVKPEHASRLALVNNFSAAGGNTALLLADAPGWRKLNWENEEKTDYVFPISAHSSTALQRNVRSIIRMIDVNTNLGSLSYTLSARRMHHGHRLSIITNTAKDLKMQLSTVLRSLNEELSVPTKKHGVGFLFTGQGAVYQGIVTELFDRFESFQRDIVDFDRVAQTQGFPSILPFAKGLPMESLSATQIQLGSCITQMALARLWTSFGVKPDYVLGHSLGEYAALQVSGILSISDAIYSCGHRAILLEQYCAKGTHGMVAVRASVDALSDIVSNTAIEISCINGPNDTVLSGTNALISLLCEELDKRGHQYIKLDVEYAFHSSQTDPILQGIDAIARRITFNAPKIPFVSTVLGCVATRSGMIGPSYLRLHCRQQVNFLGGVEAAQISKLIHDKGICVEIGGQPVLSRLVSVIASGQAYCLPTLRQGTSSFETMTASLNSLYLVGLDVDWNEYRKYESNAGTVLRLPSYGWDLEHYWRQYVNNWCLTKGDVPYNEVPVKDSPIRLSSSVQRTIENMETRNGFRILIESDLFDTELRPVIEQHKVSGVKLTPSGLYCDVAYTLTRELLRPMVKHYQRYFIEICDMRVEKALVLNAQGPQLFRAEASMDSTSLSGTMKLYSYKDGVKGVFHATCKIQAFASCNWKDEWRSSLVGVQENITRLRKDGDSLSIHRLRQKMAYKLFSTSVAYGPFYQSMSEVQFDPENLEATAQVQLQAVTGTYSLNPVWIDNLGHLSGFVIHTSDYLDLDAFAYINTGWTSVRFTEPLDMSKTYHTYVKMRSSKANGDTSVLIGDLYIFQGTDIIGKFSGVTFKKIPRQIFEHLLSEAIPSKKALNVKVERDNLRPLSQVPELIPQIKVEQSESECLTKSCLTVISEQIGVDITTVDASCRFTDLGVDSLMCLTILSSLRLNAGLNVRPSLFEHCPTVGSFKAFLDSSSTQSESTDGTMTEYGTTDTSEFSTSGDDMTIFSKGAVNLDTVMTSILNIMEQETGLSSAKLIAAPNMAAIGVDSLLSLKLLHRCRNELNLKLPADFFLQARSITKMKKALGLAL